MNEKNNKNNFPRRDPYSRRITFVIMLHNTHGAFQWEKENIVYRNTLY